MSRRVLLQVKNVHKTYHLGRVSVPVLRGVDLRVEEGEFLVVQGASGSGKSTLLHILGALDVPDEGSVTFDGFDVFAGPDKDRNRLRNRSIGFVFQFYHLLPELSLLENVMVPRLVTHSAWGWLGARRQVRRDAEAMLERVGLSERARHRPRELSGGERQRAAIARALMNNPKLLLADEPTGNLDAVIGEGILALLGEFNQEGQTIVMVTHDEAVASRAHRRVLLQSGVIQKGKAGP